MTNSPNVLFLRDFDNYNRFARVPNLTTEIGSLEFVQGQLPMDRKSDGSFWIQGQSLFALARIDGGLFIRVGDAVFGLSDGYTVDVQASGPNRVLRVMKGGVQYASVPYVVHSDATLSPDETPFVEDEDFDFGLLLSNISHSEERKRIMLEQP
ncbi:MAG: hypothetical protein ACKOAU_14255 [Pirellula sp.]